MDCFDETDREEVTQENECKICHELFLTHDASTICDWCYRLSIIEDEE